MDFSAILPTFVVTLREGVEATLVVGIVLACLKKAEQTKLYTWAYAGVGAGIAASVLVGLVLWGTIQGLATSEANYAPVIQEFLEAGFSLVAIAMLSWMLIWMTQQAKSVKSEVEESITAALKASQAAGWGVFTLIFIAVLREGFETVLFIVAKFQEEWVLPSLGAVAGLVGAVIIGVLLFQLGVKINLRLFFQVMGIFLLAIVGGLVVGMLKDINTGVSMLAQLNPQYARLCASESASCILGPQIWDASGILPDKEFPGIILKSLFGYRETLYLVQGIAYVVFMAIVGTLYFQSLSSVSTTTKKEPFAT
ncbi:MAG: FTR1 family protein [Oscillatoria sp. PMC 1051.18]|nr:FTR1 family protein [Oscillatoria sp. PMC 1050.18]MEC5032433.1 FTR1 family protein [Oscillatoria sp. PMC 1051.18]